MSGSVKASEEPGGSGRTGADTTGCVGTLGEAGGCGRGGGCGRLAPPRHCPDRAGFAGWRRGGGVGVCHHAWGTVTMSSSPVAHFDAPVPGSERAAGRPSPLRHFAAVTGFVPCCGGAAGGPWPGMTSSSPVPRKDFAATHGAAVSPTARAGRCSAGAEAAATNATQTARTSTPPQATTRCVWSRALIYKSRGA